MAASDLDYVKGGGRASLRRINVAVPNKQLADWMTGTECRQIVQRITTQIERLYYSNAPEITGNLKRGIGSRVAIGGPRMDRYYGRVYNTALSYRKQKNKPYPRYVEYGKPSKGKRGGHHLERAVNTVLGTPGVFPGIIAAPEGRGSRLRDVGSGQFVSAGGVPKRQRKRQRSTAKRKK